ncbi:unnamed protein product [Protopolystoma xenopodis]|uniref:Uncharacterized protein n=1 Tax=Protopolystoma xenopodis TaxID=117903 RepID=A0A448XEA6_9PLAT|nr:unnamed protein product [Protopolystoma xenopodis]
MTLQLEGRVVGWTEFVSCPHRKPNENCLRVEAVQLRYDIFDLFSCNFNESLLDFHPSWGRHRQSEKWSFTKQRTNTLNQCTLEKWVDLVVATRSCCQGDLAECTESEVVGHSSCHDSQHQRIRILTDAADYDVGETFKNVPSPLSDAGNHDN